MAYKGCNEPIPNLEASRPVAKGKTAEPACPKPPIQPTQPVRSHFGRTWVQ